MSKIEVYKDDKWVLLIDLNDSSLDSVIKYAELMQYKEVEGRELDDIERQIDELHEAWS